MLLGGHFPSLSYFLEATGVVSLAAFQERWAEAALLQPYQSMKEPSTGDGR